jgi:GNAT superfamily N-acetyltransferase
MIEPAVNSDAEHIYELQKLAYLSEAEIYNDYSIPPLTQSFEEFKKEFEQQDYLKATINGTLIGSVRGYVREDTCCIGRLIVHPDYQNKGIGAKLIKAIEDHFKETPRFEIFTGEISQRNLFLYQKLGYRIFNHRQLTDRVKLLYLEKFSTQD